MTEHRPTTYLRGRVVATDAVIEDGVVEGDTIAWASPAAEAAGADWPDLRFHLASTARDGGSWRLLSQRPRSSHSSPQAR